MKATVQIKGVKPLLYHKFNIECLTATRKPKEGTSGNDPNEWKNSFFHNEGNLYLPGSYIMAALKNGSVNTKAGRGTIQKTWMSAVNIDDEIIYLNRKMWDKWEETEGKDLPVDPNTPVFVDIRMVSNPNTKGRNVRYRIGLSKGWECTFTLDIDESLISKTQVRKVLEDTGKLQGVADGRTLGYGRFELIECSFK